MSKDALYHYTTNAGFLGILSSGNMYATHFAYLNDSVEIKYTIELAREVLGNLKRLLGDAAAPLTKIGRAIDSLHPFLKATSENLYNANICLCSFTGNGDLLSQWRGYCDVGGVSFSFKKHELEEFCKREKLSLIKCIYDRDVQLKEVGEIAQRYIDLISADIDSADSRKTLRGQQFILNLIDKSYIYKHPSFREEEEYRIICDNQRTNEYGLDFRSGKSSVVPYVNIPILSGGSMNLHKIIIGPSPGADLMYHSVIKMVDKYQQNCQIVKSETPFRDW